MIKVHDLSKYYSKSFSNSMNCFPFLSENDCETYKNKVGEIKFDTNSVLCVITQVGFMEWRKEKYDRNVSLIIEISPQGETDKNFRRLADRIATILCKNKHLLSRYFRYISTGEIIDKLEELTKEKKEWELLNSEKVAILAKIKEEDEEIDRIRKIFSGRYVKVYTGGKDEVRIYDKTLDEFYSCYHKRCIYKVVPIGYQLQKNEELVDMTKETIYTSHLKHFKELESQL